MAAEATVNRDLFFAAIRRSLAVRGDEAERHAAVAARLAGHPRGVIPARGQLPLPERIALFRRMVAAAAGTTTRVGAAADVPREVAALLRMHNLPMTVRHGRDPRLLAVPFAPTAINAQVGPARGEDVVGLSYAFGAVAESGTVMVLSGPDNPSSVNFLPDTHVVLVDAGDIAGDYETLWERLRARHGAGQLPRAVHLITGPSRSADVEQMLILGAHGPRRLHVIIIG